MTPPHFAWQVCGTWRHRARRFTWQAWYLATSTCVLRGRRGTSGTGLALVARFAWQLRFAWQRWHLWHWAGSGGALGPCWSPGATRHFAWQAWHLATSTVTLWQARHLATSTFVLRRHFAWQAWRFATTTFVLRGSCGTWRHQLWFCVAGVALGDIDANTQTSTQTSFTHTHLSNTQP